MQRSRRWCANNRQASENGYVNIWGAQISKKDGKREQSEQLMSESRMWFLRELENTHCVTTFWIRSTS